MPLQLPFQSKGKQLFKNTPEKIHFSFLSKKRSLLTMETYAAVFQSIGLDSKTIENTLKAKKKAGMIFCFGV